ncbi:MAG: hypothetical protein AAF658_19475, partial [Myxococcota bacterium]
MGCAVVLAGVLAGLTPQNALENPLENALGDLVENPDASLSRVNVQRVELKNGFVLRATRTYRDMPVVGEVVTARYAADGRLLGTRGEFSNLGSLGDVVLDAAHASRLAVGHLVQASVDTGELPNVAVVLTRPARLAYAVHVGSAVPQWRRTVLVDAQNGAIIEVRSPVYRAMGNVFDPHPSLSDTLGNPSEVELLGLDPASNVLDGEFVESRSCLTDDDSVRVVTCNDIASGFGCLSADLANLLLPICGEGFVAQRDVSDGFRYAPADDVSDYADGVFDDDPFVEVNAYYHIDRAARFLEAMGHNPQLVRVLSNMTVPSGGLLQCAGQAWAATNQNARTPESARAALAGCTNGSGDYAPFDNAFFLGDDLEFLVGVRSGIYMGQGTTADFGYDGDILIHEYGHAIESQVGALLGGNV